MFRKFRFWLDGEQKTVNLSVRRKVNVKKTKKKLKLILKLSNICCPRHLIFIYFIQVNNFSFTFLSKMVKKLRICFIASFLSNSRTK